MHIAMIGWLKGKPVPPTHYGGIERMTATLCTELIRQGHQVTLFAPEGSHIEGAKVVHTDNFDTVYGILNGFKYDIIHSHECWSLDSVVRRPLNTPFICTTHVNHAINWTQNVVYLSQSQRKSHGEQVGRDLHSSPVIHVPINPALKPKGLPRETHLLFLGTVAQHKGVVEAAQVANLLGRPLIVAGPTPDPEYAKKVQDVGRHVVMVGEVSDPYRSELIETAWALMCLHNSQGDWLEPGCGVFGEAMALNTPVAAFRNGCLPELVKNGSNGWIADTVDDIATFMECDEYPSGMRSSAQYYSAENMVGVYLNWYEVALRRSWG